MKSRCCSSRLPRASRPSRQAFDRSASRRNSPLSSSRAARILVRANQRSNRIARRYPYARARDGVPRAPAPFPGGGVRSASFTRLASPLVHGAGRGSGRDGAAPDRDPKLRRINKLHQSLSRRRLPIRHHSDVGGNPGVTEQLFRQRDHRLERVMLENEATNLALPTPGIAREQPRSVFTVRRI